MTFFSFSFFSGRITDHGTDLCGINKGNFDKLLSSLVHTQYKKWSEKYDQRNP